MMGSTYLSKLMESEMLIIAGLTSLLPVCSARDIGSGDSGDVVQTLEAIV